MNRIEAIRQWALEGRSLAWAGEQLGMTKQAVHQIAQKHDIKFDSRHIRPKPALDVSPKRA